MKRIEGLVGGRVVDSQTLDETRKQYRVAVATKEEVDARIVTAQAMVRTGGKAGVEHWLGGGVRQPACRPAHRPAAAVGRGIWPSNPTRLGYAGRRATGRSIGSGAVEGAIQQQVNLRRKRPGGGGWGTRRPTGRTAGSQPHPHLAHPVDRRLTVAPNERDTRPPGCALSFWGQGRQGTHKGCPYEEAVS